MKQLIVGIALAISVPAFAQNKPDTPIPVEDKRMDTHLQNRQPAILRIKVTNSTKKLIDIAVRYTIVHPGSELQETGNTKLDEHGETTIILKENLPYQQVWLTVKDLFYSGLVVNNDLNVNIDAAIIRDEVFFYGDGVSLSGPDANLNKQLMKSILYKRKEKSALNSMLPDICINAANGTIPVQGFIKKADSIYTALKRLDDDFLKENPGFDWAIKNERNSFFYQWLIVGFNNKEIPADWFAKIQQHRPYFMSNEGVGFYRSLSSHLANKNREKTALLQKELYKNKTGLTSDQKMELDKIELQQSLLSIQQYSKGPRADILTLGLMERWKDQFAYVYPILINSIESNWVKSFIESKLEQALATQRQIDDLFKSAAATQQPANYYIGKPVAELPFGASLYTLDSIQKIEDFLSNLRSKFSNKILLLDIWATWCAPCISDIPYSIKLHEENSDLPIEYIYLCTSSGSDENTWKRRIGTMKPPGNHIFIDDTLLNALRKILHAEGGYPTYVVIDREGKVNTKAISFMSGLDRDKLKTAVGIQ